jgi:hypothetical protein
MALDTINHDTLSRLAEASAIRAAHAVGQPGGYALSVQYGMAERYLAAQRSGKVRLFRRLDSLAAYLKTLGISRFDVDTSQHDPATDRQRPDRAEALRRAHAAALAQKS